MSNRVVYIYTLSCPITNEVRYVGRTIQKNPKWRYNQHIIQAKNNRKKDYCHCWIKSLLNIKKLPVFNIIEEATSVDRESFWINYYSELGVKLTNITVGGEVIVEGKRKNAINTWNVNRSKKVYIWNIDGTLFKMVSSQKELSTVFSIAIIRKINKYISLGKVYKNKYVFSYINSFPDTILYSKTGLGKKVLFKKDDEIIIFENAHDAAIGLGMSYNSVTIYASKEKSTRNKDFTLKYIINESLS